MPLIVSGSGSSGGLILDTSPIGRGFALGQPGIGSMAGIGDGVEAAAGSTRRCTDVPECTISSIGD